MRLPGWSAATPVDPKDRAWLRFVWVHAEVVMVWIAVNLIFGTSTDVRNGHHVTNGNPLTSGPAHPAPNGVTSLTQVHHYLQIPWPAWGGVFAALAVGLVIPKIRPWSFLLAAALAAFFVVTVIIYTYAAGHPTNSVTVPLGTLTPDLLFAGFRYSISGAAPRQRRPE